jgi:hypothetical protein
MLVVDLLNFLLHFISYLSSWLLACYPVMVSLCGFILIFASLDMVIDIIAEILACISYEAP